MPRWMDPPGKPWRLYAILLVPPVAIVLAIEALQLARSWWTWSAWIR